MKYKQLTSMYRDDTIAEAMYQREVEYFHYDFDRANFTEMLKTMPEGVARNELQKKINEIAVQMDCVARVYAALEAQITDHADHEAAIKRVTEKRHVSAQ